MTKRRRTNKVVAPKSRTSASHTHVQEHDQPQEEPNQDLGVPDQELQEALASFQQSQEIRPHLPQQEPAQQLPQEQEAAAATAAAIQQLRQISTQPMTSHEHAHVASSSALSRTLTGRVKRKIAGTVISGPLSCYSSAPTTTFEEPVLGDSASESESSQKASESESSQQAPPPKRTRGRPSTSLDAKVDVERGFDSLMRMLSTLRNAHVVVERDGCESGSGSTSHELHQKGTIFRLQGMEFEHENLSRNTKGAYLTYLNYFKDFCDKTYAFEQDSRYEVYEEKVLVFFKEHMFTKTFKRVFKGDSTKDVRVAIALLPRTSKAKRPPVDLRKYLEKVPQQPDGSRILEVLCERPTMDQALKAIVHLQSRQISRVLNPNGAPRLRTCKAVKDTLDKYESDLLFGVLVNYRNWSASCSIRNTYTIDEHLRCLLDAWQQPVSETSPGMRLHLSLAIRHAMVLRDEDLRGLTYSDIFMDPAANVVGGTQRLVYLMATFHLGKTNRTGKTLYGVSCRHADVRRCSIGALGFYFYDLFHVKRETLPDFDDPAWIGTKLIHTWPNVRDQLSYESQREATRSCFQRQRVSCRHITHSGRHSGAAEAKMLRIRREDIRKAGRWVQHTSKMDMYYDDEPAYYFAVQMAGFLGGQVPFHLKRNEISPSLELQRQIFPSIETAFGPPGSPEYDEWQVECIQEMEERNANDSSQLGGVLPLQYDPSARGFVPSNTRESDLTKKCFLKALLRLRRVILQDAADYLCSFKDVQSPLLAFGVFKTPAFEAFKEQIKDVLSSQDVALPEDMHPNVRMVLQDQQRLIVRQGQIMGRLPGSFESMELELQGLRNTAAERLDQAMMYWDTAFTYGMDVFKEIASRIESKLDYIIASRMDSRMDSRMESKLDYIIARLGHSISDSSGSSSRLPSSSSFPWGYGHGMTPALSAPSPFSVQSDQHASPVSRRLAPAAMAALIPPKWTPTVVQPQPQPLSQPKPLPPAMPVCQQSSVTTTTTATATTTTTTATTMTTRVGGVAVNYRLGSVAAVWEEYHEFERERKRSGAISLGISRKHQKQLNNKKRIIEEVKHLAEQSRANDASLSHEDAIQRALLELDSLFKMHSWTVNQLVNYCRDQVGERKRKAAALSM